MEKKRYFRDILEVAQKIELTQFNDWMQIGNGEEESNSEYIYI